MTFLTPTGTRSLPAPVLDRAALPIGHRVTGPALLVEYSATTVVPAGWEATVDEHGALLLRA
jgi:N-methylhydantoinase A/oxoprolinase/acetone carboxylase beta subunit